MVSKHSKDNKKVSHKQYLTNTQLTLSYVYNIY